MASLSDVFFDTSILLSGLIENLGDASSDAHAVMDAVADRRVRRPSTAWHCCLEFYSVSTSLPSEFRLSPAESLRLLEEEIMARFQVHQLPATELGAFLSDAASSLIAGGRVYDAHIGAIAEQCGARLVATSNRRHFHALMGRGIRVFDAAGLLASLK